LGVPLVAVLAAALAVVLESGAGGAARAAKPAPIDRTATIKFGTSQANSSGDPTVSAKSYFLLSAWGRPFTFDGKNNLEGMLAKSWSYSKDHKSLTIKLRDDAYFHDGTPVNALAVKMTLDRYRTTPGSAVAAVLADIDSEKIVNKYTVQINFKYG